MDNDESSRFYRLVEELVSAGRGTYVAFTSSTLDELALEWLEVLNARDPYPKWNKGTCVCGNFGWCGRDSHRPEWAVDEDGGNREFYH